MSARPIKDRSETPLFLLALVAILGIIALTAFTIAVPNILNEVVLAAIASGAAITKSTPPPAV